MIILYLTNIKIINLKNNLYQNKSFKIKMLKTLFLKLINKMIFCLLKHFNYYQMKTFFYLNINNLYKMKKIELFRTLINNLQKSFLKFNNLKIVLKINLINIIKHMIKNFKNLNKI